MLVDHGDHMTDIDWTTRGLAFLINNQGDAGVILGEQLRQGWRLERDLSGGRRDSYVAGFSYALALLGVPVNVEDALLERSSDS